jgi:hypothetical protein
LPWLIDVLGALTAFLLRRSSSSRPLPGCALVQIVLGKTGWSWADSNEWSEFETKIWKPIQEARIKDGQMRAWGSYLRLIPSGSGQPYSALTADIFPSWDTMWKQKPLVGYVKQAHPNMSDQEFSVKTTRARDLVSREIFKIILAAGSLPR